MSGPPLRHSGMATPKVEDIAPFAFWGAIANASYALLHVFPDGNLPTRFTEALRNAHMSIARRIPADELAQMAPPSTATPLEILTFYGTPANKHRRNSSNAGCSAGLWTKRTRPTFVQPLRSPQHG